MKWRRGVLALLLVVAAACSDSRQTIRGVVIEVQGGITEVDGFLMRTENGATLRLQPADGVLFHGDAPIGHIRDHLRTGEQIEVDYEVLDDGTVVAWEIRD